LVEHAQQLPATQLLTYFRDKHTLLILDNFEHIVSAAPLITQLLQACPWLYVLVTTRLPLQVRGEQYYAVHPLAFPAADQIVSFEQVADYSAVALFVNCAQAVKADWVLTPKNAPAVIDICRRLDGLPLAIELAAAHSCWLSPHNMIDQLCSNYPILLSKGFRDSSARQQTLRTAIDWSYHLLDPATQHLFARLAVFRGGWTLQAATAICNQQASPGNDSDAACTAYLSKLLTLVDHSLLRQEETQAGEVRFTMLHTMREYAGEHLNARGEMRIMQERHARYFRDLAEHLEPLLRGEKQLAAVQWIEQEYANFHAVLNWYRSAPNGVEDGLRLAGALGEFWFIRSNFVQGLSWLQAFLTRDCRVPLAVRAKALRYAAVLASPQGDVAQALRWNHESLAAYQTLDDPWGIAYTLASLGDVHVWHNHDPEQGQEWFTQSLRLAREIDDLWLLARVTWRVGMYHYYLARGVAQAQVLLEESLATASEIHDLWGMSNALPHVANIACEQGDSLRACALLEQALELARRIGNQRSIATTLNVLGMLALGDGKYDQARAYHEESLAVAQSAHLAFQQATALYFLGQSALHQHFYGEAHARFIQSIKQHYTLNAKLAVAACVIALADVFYCTKHLERAAQLLGTATYLLEKLDTRLTQVDQCRYEEILSLTYAQLDLSTWNRAWEEGQKMSVQQVICQEEADVSHRSYSGMEGRGISIELGRSADGPVASTSRWGNRTIGS
jgi:predicted ATPase